MLYESAMLKGVWIKYEYNPPQNGRNEIWPFTFKLWCSTTTQFENQQQVKDNQTSAL